MADAADLKSDVERRVGSNPTGGTYLKRIFIIRYGFKARRIEIDMSTETYYTDNTMYHTFSDPDYVITASLQDTQSMTHMLRKFINIANTRLKISKKGCIYELYT